MKKPCERKRKGLVVVESMRKNVKNTCEIFSMFNAGLIDLILVLKMVWLWHLKNHTYVNM